MEIILLFSRSLSKVIMASKVGLVVILVMAVWEVNCQETRLNVIFPQLEMIGSAPDGRGTTSTAAPPPAPPPAPADRDALRLQQLQSEIARLRGLFRTLVIDDVSARNESLGTSTARPAVTTPPIISTTQKPKETALGGGIANFFANLGSETSANANDFDMNSLHSEIEALQKQLSGRDDNNSRNSFINQPIKESPTTFHFHNDKHPTHQSYFDHSARGDKNPYFRSAEPSVSEVKYDYVIEPLPSPMPGNHVHPVSKNSNTVEHAKAKKKNEEESPEENESQSLILRHQHNTDYENLKNGYDENYTPHSHHRPAHYDNDYRDDYKPHPYHGPSYYETQKYGNEGYDKPHLHHHHRPFETPTYGYGEGFRHHPSDNHNYESRPEYGPARYEETKDYTQPQMYGTDANGYGVDKHRFITPGSTSLHSRPLNTITGGGTSVQNVILQFILEVVRMIAGGNSTGVVSMVLRLPGVILRSFLQTASNALANNGLRGVIARGIVPLIVLIVANVLIIFLTWFMWEDGSCQKNNSNMYDSKY